jgi:hypothetical protein
MDLRVKKLGNYLSDKGKELCLIMKSLLLLNPYLRMTAYECILNFKVFDSVRKPLKEKVLRKLYLLSFSEHQINTNKNRLAVNKVYTNPT